MHHSVNEFFEKAHFNYINSLKPPPSAATNFCAGFEIKNMVTLGLIVL